MQKRVEAPHPNRRTAATARGCRSAKTTPVVTVQEQSRTHPKTPAYEANPQRRKGSPHADADGPVLRSALPGARLFAPRGRGWSDKVADILGPFSVRPTRTRMVRCASTSRRVPGSSPHADADGPASPRSGRHDAAFAPRERGWSHFSPLSYCVRLGARLSLSILDAPHYAPHYAPHPCGEHFLCVVLGFWFRSPCSPLFDR